MTCCSLQACLLCDWSSSEAVGPFIPVLLCAHFAPEQPFQGFRRALVVGVGILSYCRVASMAHSSGK